MNERKSFWLVLLSSIFRDQNEFYFLNLMKALNNSLLRIYRRKVLDT
ncbi:hypothetical protein PMEGAPL125_14630 [Priestia megaterium]